MAAAGTKGLITGFECGGLIVIFTESLLLPAGWCTSLWKWTSNCSRWSTLSLTKQTGVWHALHIHCRQSLLFHITV